MGMFCACYVRSVKMRLKEGVKDGLYCLTCCKRFQEGEWM